MVVVRLLWLSSRALAAQARGVLGSTNGFFTFLYFHLITSKFIYGLSWAKLKGGARHAPSGHILKEGDRHELTTNTAALSTRNM